MGIALTSGLTFIICTISAIRDSIKTFRKYYKKRKKRRADDSDTDTNDT